MIRRIAVITYHSTPLADPGAGDAGGMTVYVRALAEELARRGIRTDIFTRASGIGPPVFELGPGVRVISIPAGPARKISKEETPRFLDQFVAGVRVFATTQRVGYDAIHSHYWQSGLAGIELSSSWGVPFVHSAHTLGPVKNRFLPPGDDPEPPERLVGERSVIQGADVLIASTAQEARDLARFYDASLDKVKVVHPGVDRELFSPHGDDGGSVPELSEEPAILAVGRIQPLKGLDLAIRATEQLAGALDPPPRLVVVGGASGRGGERELDRLDALAASLQLHDRVHFLGPRPHRELPRFYRAAHAVVVCSHSESFGLAALEAQSCGTPVVGTPVGGLAHVVRDGRSGFLVDGREPAVFAGRLKTLLSDPDLAAGFSSEAIRSASTFSWERAGTEVLDLYECLAAEVVPEACVC